MGMTPRWARLAAPVVAMVLLSAGVVASGVPAAAHPATAASATRQPGTEDGGLLSVFSPKYMDRGALPSRDKALADAANFDFFMAHPKDYQRHLAAMRAVNPDLVVVAYVDAVFTPDPNLPDAWYTKSASGARITHSLYDTYLMNPNNPDWVAHRVQACRTIMASSGYDGCVYDGMGTTPVDTAGYVTAFPINPATGAQYTVGAWLTGLTRLIDEVVQGNPGRPIWANGLGGGPRFFLRPSPSRWMPLVTGGMIEGFLHRGRDLVTTYPSDIEWRQNIDMLQRGAANGWPMAAVTKTWNTGTQAQKDAWHRFALSSYLIGASATSTFFFTYDILSDQSAWHPYWNTSLGAPLGQFYTRANGTVARDFVRGMALVNPTSVTKTVTLPRAGTTLDGVRLTTITLGPKSGDVLTW